MRTVQQGVAAVKEGREPPAATGSRRPPRDSDGPTQQLNVLVGEVLDQLGVVIARIQQVETTSRSEAVLLLRERAAGLEATIKDLSARPDETALIDAVDAISTRVQSLEGQLQALDGRIESTLGSRIDEMERLLGPRFEDLGDRVHSINAGVNASADDLYRSLEQLLVQHLEESAAGIAPRLEALEERVGAINPGVNDAVTALYGAVEQLLTQRLEANAQTTVPRLDLLQERLGAVTGAVQDTGSELLIGLDQVLNARLEDATQVIVPRLDALQAQLGSSTAGRLDELEEHLARTSDERLDALEKIIRASMTSRLDALEQSLSDADAERLEELVPVIDRALGQRLEDFQAILNEAEESARGRAAEALDLGQQAVTTAGERLTEQVENLAEANRRLYQQLGRRVVGELTAQREMLTTQAASLTAQTEVLAGHGDELTAQREALEAINERFAAQADAAQDMNEQLTAQRESVAAQSRALSQLGERTGTIHGGVIRIVERLQADDLGENLAQAVARMSSLEEAQGKGVAALDQLQEAIADSIGSTKEDLDLVVGRVNALDERVGRLMHFAEALSNGVRQTSSGIEVLGERVLASAETLDGRLETIESGRAIDRDASNQRLEVLHQTLADHVRLVETATASADRRLEAVRNDLVGATTGLTQSLTARSEEDASRAGAVRQQLQRVDEAMSRLAALTGERLEAEARAVVAALERSASELQQSVMTAVFNGMDSLRKQMLERIGPEATMPELLLAFGEAQEQAVTQALSQLGEGPLKGFAQDLVRLEQTTRELVGRNERTLSTLDVVKSEGQETVAAVQELANRIESNQAQVDGVRDSLANIFDSIERLRSSQGDLRAAFNQLRANSLQREDASNFMSEVATVNAELLRHRGWLESMSSHLHAINDNMAALQAWAQRGSATFAKPADLGPSAEGGRF